MAAVAPAAPEAPAVPMAVQASKPEGRQGVSSIYKTRSAQDRAGIEIFDWQGAKAAAPCGTCAGGGSAARHRSLCMSCALQQAF